MRAAIACLLALSAALVSTPPAQAQAGRYIPLPRLPSGGGGGRFIPHIPFHLGGQGSDDVFWIVVAVLGALLLVFLSWHVGRAVGRWFRPPAERPGPSWPPGPTAWQTTAPPPMQDLILQPHEVATKAEQTRRLLEFLAYRDHALDPNELQRCIATTFGLVQKAWEARDYGPVRHLLLPNILAKHESLLKSMRNNHEINRIEGLRVERFEFVHLHCPTCADDQEVTALITFRASVYFVDDRTGAYTRGLRSPGWFQELWAFRRRGEGWLLQEIEQSHESDRHERPNFVADLTDQQSANVQSSIAL
jgi:hypothetical protein